MKEQINELFAQAKKDLEFEKYLEPLEDWQKVTNSTINKALFVFEKLSKNLNKILNDCQQK